MEEKNNQPDNPYDEMPYVSRPFAQTHPDRLATIATLFGLDPPEVDSARILELGCASGGNLLPLAEQLPKASLVGIDASRVQVEVGQKIVADAQLDNVRLYHKDIMEVDSDFGQFDFVIAHGVYSWVPNDVQRKILQICRDNLSPSGIAYVSYNTFPGWHMRGMVRDMMKYRTRRITVPPDRVRMSRGLLDFLAETVPTKNNAYGILLNRELELLRKCDDSYLFHEHLEEHNDPLYFYEFIERAESQGLQFLGEADFSSIGLRNSPRNIQAMLRGLAENEIEIEQYMDFVRNRMFRQTLLCKSELQPDRTPSPSRIQQLHLASSAVAQEKDDDVNSDTEVVFDNQRAFLRTREPLVKAAMYQLKDAWPESIPFSTLLAKSRSVLSSGAVVVDTEQVSSDAEILARPMLDTYTTKMIELSVNGSRFSVRVGNRAKTTRFARLQASQGNNVTNLRHENVRLNDLQRAVLRQLDGSQGFEDILSELAEMSLKGQIFVHLEGEAVSDPAEIHRLLTPSLKQSLDELAAMALLLPSADASE